MRQTIVGLFDTAEEARKAVNKLTERGFDRSRIDVSRRTEKIDSHHNDKHDDDDGIKGFFRSLFGSDNDDADKYSRVANESDSIVTVHADTREEAERAADILDDAGTIDVDDRAKQYGYNTNNTRTDYNQTGTATDTRENNTKTNAATDTSKDFKTNKDSDNASMKAMEEDVKIGKRTVQTGGTRLRSRIVERPVEEHLRLRKEHVTVDRNPVNRKATDTDRTAFNEGKVEMTEKAEVPVVSKDTRVVEEVSLKKDVNVKDETVRDTARKTEVNVEHFDEDQEYETADTDSNHGENKRRY